MEATAPSQDETLAQRLLALLVLAGLAATVLLSVPWDADPGWWDASRHAMDGAFYMDFLRDGAFSSPVRYAQDYYARYPAIAPVIYPPLLGVVEAAFFAPLGPHPWVARLVVALFLLWGAWGLRRIACDIMGPVAGLAAGALYMTLPLVFEWSREVMLEPAAAAFLIWAFASCRRFLALGRTRDLALCFASAVLGVYTKQNAFFAFPAILLAAVLAGRAGVLRERRVWIATACAAAAGIPIAYVTLRWGKMNLDQAVGDLPMGHLSTLGHATYHARMLPSAVGWPVLLLCVPGALALAPRRLDRSIVGTWMAVCYLMMAIVRIKEPRHGFFWMPPFALLGGLGFAALAGRVAVQGLRPVLAAGAAALLMAVQVARAPVNWCEGFEAVAGDLDRRWEGAALLVSVEHDGSLIFRLRALDPDLQRRVYRSEKIFESMFVYKSWGVDAKVGGEDEILDAIRRYGIRYTLVEDDIRDATGVERMLRACLRTPWFEEAAAYEVRYPPGSRPRRLVLYRYTGPIADPPDSPTFYLPIAGMEFQR